MKGALCNLCNRKRGVVVRCAKDGCKVQIHPYCAMIRKCFVDSTKQEAYCLKHAPKGCIFNHETRQWSQPESEVRALAKLRHQMDHARVLVDRVRRREKVKRQLFNAETSEFDCIASQISDALAFRMNEPEDDDGTAEITSEVGCKNESDGGGGGGGDPPPRGAQHVEDRRDKREESIERRTRKVGFFSLSKCCCLEGMDVYPVCLLTC
jgi:hypothetical protein